MPGIHRTPNACFAAIDDYPFDPHYINIGGLRMHHVDKGSGEAGIFMLLHGETVWSYMDRDAIHGLAAAGYRVIAPDNIGFGKSNKVSKFGVARARSACPDAKGPGLTPGPAHNLDRGE